MALLPTSTSSDKREGPLQVGFSWQILSVPLIGLFVLPLLALIFETTPAALLENLKSPRVLDAIWLSTKTSLLATLFTLILGTPVAVLLARKTFPGHRIVDTLVDLPMVLPPAVAGVALLMAFGRRGLIGGPLGLEIPFTQMAVILAQMFVAAPLYVRSAIIGISGIDRDLEDAAVMDGAGTWQVLRFVTFPLTQKALIGGAVLTWARALGEFGATIIFAGNLAGRTQTMPLAIFIGFELDLQVAITLSVLLMAVSFIVLVGVRALIRG